MSSAKPRLTKTPFVQARVESVARYLVLSCRAHAAALEVAH